MKEPIMSQNAMGVFIIILLIVSVALIAICVIMYLELKRERERIDRFLQGQDGSDLEEVFLDRFDRLKMLEERDKAEEAAIKEIYRRFQGAYQKMSIVKYDAFTENGGKLSFAMAMLDELDNGFIMNVMNSRDGSYCYVKEVITGRCETAMGNEEAIALEQAMNQKRSRNVRH